MHVRTRLAASILGLGAFVTLARADVLVHADGRRTEVRAPRADSKGRWTAEREGRRVTVEPGDVVAIVDDAGRETLLKNELRDAPWTKADDVLLARLVSARDDEWRVPLEELVTPPRREALAKLQALANEKRAETRTRAVTALACLRTTEGVRAAAEAVLAERDARARTASVSALYSVVEIYRRAELNEITKRGLEDKTASVRFAFAWLAPDDLAEAVPVLKKDGLQSSDHHVSESAALALARHGDAAGEPILISMLARDRIPGISDAARAEFETVREQVSVCEALGKLGTKRALVALEGALSSARGPVRAAAEAALKRARGADSPR